jgi:hypothetical protein
LFFNLIDKEYEETAALKEAEDQGKRIQMVRERHQQLRQLFFKQARTNRIKVNFSHISSFFIYHIQHFSIKNGLFHILIIILCMLINMEQQYTIEMKLLLMMIMIDN